MLYFLGKFKLKSAKYSGRMASENFKRMKKKWFLEMKRAYLWILCDSRKFLGVYTPMINTPCTKIHQFWITIHSQEPKIGKQRPKITL